MNPQMRKGISRISIDYLHLHSGASPVQLASISQVRNDWPTTVWPAEQRYCTVEPILNESVDERSLFE